MMIDLRLVAVLVVLLLVALWQYYLASTGQMQVWPNRLPGAGGLGNT